MSSSSMNESQSSSHSRDQNQSYYLSRIEVYNWGGFSGFHEAHIDEAGTAIVGQTGSGKTTLIDALLTLLIQYPRYNFASTGGHESDRSLMSYIRGIAGSGEGLERVARGGKTVTGLTAYFSACSLASTVAESSSQQINDHDQRSYKTLSKVEWAQADLFAPNESDEADQDSHSSNISIEVKSNPEAKISRDTTLVVSNPDIAIGGVFWLDSSSNSANDRKDVWLVAKRESNTIDSEQTQTSVSGLKEWLTQFVDGGSRGLKAWARNEDNVNIYDSKSAYLAKVRQLFDVNEQAFTLLGRAVGLKQLNSIDEIFRDLVLEDNASFKRASEVIAQFDDLSAIKSTLEIAKRQYDTLAPLASFSKQRQASQDSIHEFEEMQTALPVWFAHHAQSLWRQRLSVLDDEIIDLKSQRDSWQQICDEQDNQLNALKDRYREQGGSEIESLKVRIDEVADQLEKRISHRQQYSKVCQQLDLVTANTSVEFIGQQQALTGLKEQLDQQLQYTQKQINEVGANKFRLTDHLDNLNQELTHAQAQKSNIPPKFEQFRHQLAEHLEVEHKALPYVAQLIEVKSEEQAWRGAIERALGSHRLRLLVPEQLMSQALRWVNSRDNRLHVRLYAASLSEQSHQQIAPFFADGYLRKLNYQAHPLTEALKQMLAKLDRHCVANTQALEFTSHAMTEQGLMSNQTGWYDKQDQKRLGDDWLTGFDNRDLIKRLQDDIDKTEQQLSAIKVIYQKHESDQSQINQQVRLLERLRELDFDSIDVMSYEQRLANLQQQYSILIAPDSDLDKLKQQIDELTLQSQQSAESLKQTSINIGIKDSERSDGNIKFNKICEIIQTAPHTLQTLDAPILKALSQQVVVISSDGMTLEILEDLPHLEKQAASVLAEQLKKAEERRHDIEQKIIRQMGQAKRDDTGELSEVHTELKDLPTYLQRLQFLREEDLPSKQEQFLAYLNESSKSSVTQLLTDVNDEVDKINMRIEDLNHIMRKVDFEADKYLRLNATPVVHASLRELVAAQKRLLAVTLAMTDDDGEAHYRALLDVITQLQEAVDKKHTLAAKALLDPRHRLTFSVSVMSRLDDSELESRTGSQGGSGGEKEIIASHILTASLSYALNPNNLPLPKFATIVLDEAFSKSSPQVATRIVDAIREFGLHPLFVTPNKEMRLLRAHTKSAVLVVKKGSKATLSNWSWQQLSDKSAQKLAVVSSVYRAESKGSNEVIDITSEDGETNSDSPSENTIKY